MEPGAPAFVWAGKGSRIVTMASALYDSLLQFGEAEANARLIAAAPELAKENEELRAEILLLHTGIRQLVYLNGTKQIHAAMKGLIEGSEKRATAILKGGEK